jgi:hypothetical protein
VIEFIDENGGGPGGGFESGTRKRARLRSDYELQNEPNLISGRHCAIRSSPSTRTAARFTGYKSGITTSKSGADSRKAKRAAWYHTFQRYDFLLPGMLMRFTKI